MTDSEIVKALECYRGQKLFAFNGKKPEIYIHDIIDLINRLQAENEDIKFLYENLKEEHLEIIKAIKRTKAEAYKECIEKVKDEKFKTSVDAYTDAYILGEDDLDNLVKELVGDNQ